MGNHSNIVGGSSAARYINCIGSTALRKMVPADDTSSEAALRGTMLHFVMEELLSNPDLVPEDMAGELIELDELDADGNAITLELTAELIATKIRPALDWFENALIPDQYWLEVEVHFDGELAGAFGSADVLYLKDGQWGIVDWKFGDNVLVSADDNSQMKFYTTAALKLPWFGADNQSIDAHIVQPIEGHDRLCSSAVYTLDELNEFEARLLAAKQAKDSGDTTLTIGGWCTFCPAITICSAYRDRAQQAMASIPAEALKAKDPETKGYANDYDHDQLREMFFIAQEVTTWAEAVKRRVKDAFDNGRPVDGLKRVVHQKLRQYADEEKAKGFLRRQGLKADEYYQARTLISVAAAEKLLKARDAKPLPDKLVIKQPKGYQIVTVDDPRDAVADSNNPAEVSAALGDALNAGK